MKTKCFSCLILSLLFSVSLWGQEAAFEPDYQSAIDEAVQQQIKEQDLVGVSIGVVNEGKVSYLQAYGFEDREQQIPAATKTMYRWASISKTLTAVAAMQLVEKGLLNLDDDVRKFVPEFPDKDSVITVRDLMCHQGGIVHYTNGKVVVTERQYDSEHPFEDVICALDRFRESPLVCVPGELYSYSTHGYILLSAVVERAGKQKFADQVDERISTPLGLDSLQPDYAWLDIPHRSVGYRKHVYDSSPRVSTNTDVSWKLGGGGFISNIEDATRYAEGLINQELLRPESFEKMWTKQKLKSGKATQVGLGFFVSEENGERKIYHNGSQEKVKARMVIYPKSKRGVVVMTNSEHGRPAAITKAIMDAIANVDADINSKRE